MGCGYSNVRLMAEFSNDYREGVTTGEVVD